MKQPSNHMLRVIASLPLLLVCITSGLAQDRPALCDTDSLIISTGWDRLKDTLEIWKEEDPYWRVVDIVANPAPTSLGVWNATIGGPAPISGGECQRIHPFDTRFWPHGTVTLETEICVTEIVSEARLVCDFIVHTGTHVLLNGTLLDETGPNGAGTYDPAHIDMDVTPYLKLGLNQLQVEITTRPDQPGSKGFALTGHIAARSDATETPFSCDACGQVLPRGNEP